MTTAFYIAPDTRMGMGANAYVHTDGSPMVHLSSPCGDTPFVIDEIALRADIYTEQEKCAVYIIESDGNKRHVMSSADAGFGDRRKVNAVINPGEYVAIYWTNCLPKTTVHANVSGHVK